MLEKQPNGHDRDAKSVRHAVVLPRQTVEMFRNRLANHLRNSGVGKPDGVLTPKQKEILSDGSTYVVLDQRLQNTLERNQGQLAPLSCNAAEIDIIGRVLLADAGGIDEETPQLPLRGKFARRGEVFIDFLQGYERASGESMPDLTNAFRSRMADPGIGHNWS